MIHFDVNMDDLVEIESALGMMKDKSKLVLKNAINQTAKQTMDMLIDEAKKEYRITQKQEVKKTLSMKPATAGRLYSVVTSRGRVNELYNFVVLPRAYRPSNKPSYHKGNVRSDQEPGNLILNPGASGDQYKAFVVRYRSGHITIGQRVPGKRMKSNPEKEFVKTLLSPSVPNMLGYEQGVYGIVEPKMYDVLQRNIEAQIQRFLGK